MRKLLLLVIVTITGITFMITLFRLQVLKADEFKIKSELNAVKKVLEYPERGFIYDRNGKLMVANQVAYDVMVTPRDIKKLDTLELCKLLQVELVDFKERLQKAKNWSNYRPSVLIPQLTQEEFAPLQEKLRKFPGFYIQRRSLRKYLVNHSASVLGYIREVNQRIIKKDPYYQQGDLAGMSGIENYYEDSLRGKKGVKHFTRDRLGRPLESYQNGRYDTIPQAGKDLTITLDNDLQAYGELLMSNKRGGIVAIEPQSGEILSLITAPNYDPSILMGRDRSKNINKILRDTIRKPNINRALQAQYAPGSPFKILNALVGLQEKVISTTEALRCNHGYNYGGRKPLGCHSHKSPVNLNLGIAESCNSYFAQVYRRIIEKAPNSHEGMDNWNKHITSFGLGNYLGYDLPVGQKGRVPDGDYYDKWYPDFNWYATTTISNAIGQGEVVATPIQLANMTAAIANRGHYFRPHIIKKIDNQPIENPKYTERIQTTIEPKYFEPVIEGMTAVYKTGTAKYAQIPGIEICGKTGTVENFMKIDGKTTQLTDHSVFIAFAPKNDPQIAIAVFVENGYWGSRYAAKIASLMIEKHIKGNITRKDLEDYLLTHSLEYEYEKPYSGKPFIINEPTDANALIDPNTSRKPSIYGNRRED